MSWADFEFASTCIDPAPGKRKSSGSRGVAQTANQHSISIDSRGIFALKLNPKSSQKLTCALSKKKTRSLRLFYIFLEKTEAIKLGIIIKVCK